jgi:hypothetical protein
MLVYLPALNSIPSPPMTAHGMAATATVSADWAENVPQCVRHALARMNLTLTLAEAKAELARVLIERHRAWESARSR